MQFETGAEAFVLSVLKFILDEAVKNETTTWFIEDCLRDVLDHLKLKRGEVDG